MSYRNDHEAALLRVDALEQEVARLRTTPLPPITKPATRRRPHASLMRFGVAMLLAGAGVAVMIARDRPMVEAAPPPTADRVMVPSSVAALRDCIAAITPSDLNAVTADPHGAASSVAPIAKTGAACRKELASLADLGLDPLLSSTFKAWAVTEDRLADPISMIAVYYGSDPYLLDNYATAPQLWREYHRAVAARDAVLADLKPMLANTSATR